MSETVNKTKQTVNVLLEENRIFPPSQTFKDKSELKSNDIYTKASEDSQGYWEQCAQKLDWFQKWDTVLEWKVPFSKWFVGGKLNVSYNCLDRHVKNGLGSKTAIMWEGEPGDSKSFTYEEVYNEVNKLANVLKGLGVQKGDRVAMYMPMVPEAVFAMQACARIGAVHTVVFGGFSVDSLKDRINDAQAKLLITSDGGWRRGKTIPLKETSDQAVVDCPTIENVLVIQRTENTVDMKEGRDHWYHDLMKEAKDFCEPEPMDAEDILFILYTSGTTGKPKGIVHTTGGYLTGVTQTTRVVFDLQE
ncbi:Acetyl-CoA synthetase, partial [hydrothermal vent metagenome]